MFMYFWERQRQTVSGVGAERERETSNLKPAPGSELSAQSLMRGSNSPAVDHDLSRSRTLNWLSHPSAPKYFKSLTILINVLLHLIGVLTWISLMTNNVPFTFVGYADVIFHEMPVHISCPYFYCVIGISGSSLYNLDVNPWRICWKCLLAHSGLSFHSLNVVFWSTEVFKFDVVQFVNLFLYVSAFMFCFTNIFQPSRSENMFPCYLLEALMFYLSLLELQPIWNWLGTTWVKN